MFTLIVFFFLPSSIPIHFNAGGIADSYGDRIQIFLFPLLQLMILLLTGREKLRYWLTHSKTFLNDIQYNCCLLYTSLHEAGIASNRESECRGEYVPGSCTHRPSHHGSQ